MKIFIFFSIFIVVSSTSYTQQEAQNYFVSTRKHFMLRDPDIVHDDVELHYANGTIRYKDYEINLIKSFSSERVKRYENYYKELVKYSAAEWSTFWDTNIAKFRPDGLLELKMYENNRLKYVYIGKQDPYIEGGYMLYRYIEY
ncbi:unnamed protein product [Caenorhabditis angaria]|uniref:Uncharacterized protein n=1 Tax=Caenorhabditis angaria TaxID=860376 RepID=A0A9P1MXM0_9PELO|nr:unnamed protein product [Caenorhabditis angaria]